MKEYSVAMSLVDFIPVILFAIGAVILQRGLYNKMSKGAFALFAAGTIDVIFAGAMKATYKLLYALGACDFEALNAVMFPVQSIGFLLAGLGVIAMLAHRQTSKGALAAVAPPVFTGTFIFVSLMVAGLGMMDCGLSIVAAKMKKPLAIILFVISFVCSLGMGYLSTKDFSGSAMNWIAEGVNIVGQAAFMFGAIVLKKAGLDSFKLRKESEND